MWRTLFDGVLTHKAGSFDESKHPRHPKGSDQGGEFAPTGTATSAVSSLVWKNPKPQLASQMYGHVPERDGLPVPVKTIKKYHVTKREYVDAILKDGFDLRYIKPRWQNDYAISLNSGSLKQAKAYFSNTGKPMDTKKYAVLEVTVRGRFYDFNRDGMRSFPGASAQRYAQHMLNEGWDATTNIFVYNPKAIMSIREVE